MNRRKLLLACAVPVLQQQEWDDLGIWRVTAYSLPGITASGEYVHSGIVAAPFYIPFGTVLYLDGIGTVTVKDRGGAIYNNRLDIWLPTYQEAVQFGVRWLQVFILR